MRRLPYPLVLIAPLFAISAAQAQNEIYKCVDSAGRPRYTNVKKEAQERRCKRVTREVSVVPTSAIPAAPAPARPAGAGSSSAGATNTAATNFPRVDAKTQKSRDQGRRQILQDELGKEEQSLAAARARLTEEQARVPGGSGVSIDRLLTHREAVERHERNIGSLKREIADLK